MVGSPLVFDNQVCTVAYQGKIGCFDVNSGNALWSRDFSSSVGLEVDPRFIVAPDDQGKVFAFTHTGSLAWKQEQLADREPTAPLSQSRYIVLGDRLGLVHWLARDTGAVVTRARTDGSPIVATPVAADRNVIVQTAAGKLFAFSIE